MLQLRPYQNDGINIIRDMFRKHKHVIYQLTTGGGKSLIFSELTRLSNLKNTKILILSSRTEILNQNGGALKGRGLNIEYVSPKQKKVPKGNIILAMAQTLKRRVDKQEWIEMLKGIQMVIIDECHEQTSNFIFDCISPQCYVLGVTASPVRYGSQRQLGLDYESIASTITTKELVGLGFLSKAKHYAIASPKLENPKIDSANGDYNQKWLSKHFETKVIYKGITDNYMRLTPHKKAIVFCVSGEQTIQLTKEFNNIGVSAKYLLSSVREEDDIYSTERKQLIQDFADGNFDVLVNCGCLVAGFDDPSIEVCILAFSTLSLTKYLQCIGRASRVTATKKTFYILDFGGCIEKHGFFEQDRKWSLWHNSGQGGGIPQTKECPQCNRLIAIGYQDCPFCHYHFPTKQEEYDVYLEEIVTGETDESKMTIPQYCAKKKLLGWKNDWIIRNILSKNPDNKKKAFNEALEVLRDENGNKISPSYFWMFTKYKFKKK